MRSPSTRVSPRRRRLLTEQLEQRRLLAGPYAPAAGEVGSTAVASDDLSIVAWATGVASYVPGTNLDAEFRVPERAIGPAEGTSGDAVSLGRGGEITLVFDAAIRDGIGPDFAVFENNFSDSFLELGFVAVSSDGTNFFEFENDSLTPAPVNAFGSVDPTDIHNFAGKYRQGFGTPFDLEELADASPLLDITSVTHVRLTDIVGDGSQTDSSGDPIYDPFPTVGSAGLDVDGVAVFHQAEFARDVIGFEDVGAGLAAESSFNGPVPGGTMVTDPFGGTVIIGTFESESLTLNNAHSTDFGSWAQWAYANGTDRTTSGFSNQFSSFAGGGANGSPTFGIGFQDQGDFFDLPRISRPNDAPGFQSLMVTNTTYTALSMRDGDSFAKKFGGADGTEPDYLQLVITGKDADDNAMGSVDFYLADYRFTDSSLDYIVDDWVEVDLRPIADALSLEFSIDSSDIGPFGINTPAFFAVDDITLAQPVLPIDIADREVSESDGTNATFARVSRSDNDTTTAIDVTVAPVDSGMAIVPTTVAIPAGQRYVEFPIGVVDNDLVDGDRKVILEAMADGSVAGSRELTIRDDDVRQLTLTVAQSTLDEGSSLQATVHRNDADVSESLVVQVSASPLEILEFAETVTIGSGQQSATFRVTAIDDDVDRPLTQVSLITTATDYVEASATVDVTDNDQPAVSIEIDRITFSESEAAPTARLEEVGRRLPPESFYNGADEAAGFVSEGLFFSNDFDSTFGSWAGWSYSNTTDTTTPGFANQYSSFAGAGAAQSDTYAVAAAFSDVTPPTVTRDPAVSGEFRSLAVTNTTYAGLSMLQGDDFAKKFGGADGDDPDFFLLTIEGFDASQMSVGTVDFYLADFRFTDNTLDYIVDEWTTVDLSPIATAVELSFSLSSSDVGSFGMNTPAYFAVDQISLASQMPPPTVTLRRNAMDVTSELEVALASSDPTEANLPSSAIIPAGASSVTVPLQIVDDAVVDGDQTVMLEVIADSHASSSVLVTVEDDEVASLFLSVSPSSVTEPDGQGRMVVHRNVDDTVEPLNVELSASPDNQIRVPAMVVIPAGQRSVEFSFAVEDNAIVDGDRFVSIEATADGFATSVAMLSVLDNDVEMPTLGLELDLTTLSESDAPPTIMLEDIGARLAAESFNNGADASGGFRSGPVDSTQVQLNNTFDPMFGSWGGWAISNQTDNTSPGFSNQYSAITGGGARNSATYAVASAFPGDTAPTISMEAPQAGQSFESLMVTNTAYAALSMANGDAFAKKFGGESGDDPDFFLLTIEGRDEDGESVGVVEFYLADFRFGGNSQDYIVDEWTAVDVSSLATASRLEFSLTSSDVGEFGMNTPAYFAVDDVILSSEDAKVVTATVTRSDTDLVAPLRIDLSADDSNAASLPPSVVIPSGAASVTFAVRAVDDAVVDGANPVVITASTDTHTPSTATLTVEDDDDPRLTLSVSPESIDESEGESASQLLIHRNSADLSSPLEVALSVTGDDVVVPELVTIPAGSASLVVATGANDNLVREGDRDNFIDASAEGFTATTAPLHITDDEISGLLVDQANGMFEVGELLGRDEFYVSLLSKPLSSVVVDVMPMSGDVKVDVSLLVFTPDEWNVPQAVGVQGVPDLEIEDDEVVTIGLSVDADNSDSLFADTQATTVDVLVRDHQPQTLRVGEDEASLFVMDEDAGIRIASGEHGDGIQVVANDLPQTILIDSLARSRGLVRVDASGGDDTVVVRGPRFTSLAGGGGYDELVLKLDVPIDLVDLLDSRVVGFERIVLASETEAELQIDTQRLATIVSPGEALRIRTDANQNLKFVGQYSSEQPTMIGNEFAQVVRVDDVRVQVISWTPWRNVASHWDVNRSGDVTSLDALAVVNQISRASESALPPIAAIEDFGGLFFDVSGDGHITSLDALRVINELARRQLRGEQESIFIAPPPLSRSDTLEEEADLAMATSHDRPLERVVATPPPRDEAIRQLYIGDEADSVEESADLTLTLLSEEREAVGCGNLA